MHSRPAYSPPPSVAVLALAAALACSDTPPAAPAAPAAPAGVDPALPVVVADATGAADAVSSVAAARAAGAVRSSASVEPTAAAAQALPPPVDVGTIPGAGCSGTSLGADINNLGQVVGNILPFGLGCAGGAYLWTEEAGVRDLGNLGWAYAINDAGQVVGQGDFVALRETHPALWTAEGGLRDLGRLAPGDEGFAAAINAAGQVVGQSGRDGASFTGRPAFLWTPEAGMRALAAVGGPTSGVTDINDGGQVVGLVALPGGGFRPVLWDAAGGMRPIAERPGFKWAAAQAINNAGQVVVADQSLETGRPGGFVWEEGRPPEPIGPFPAGVVGLWPSDINDRGQVAGTAQVTISIRPQQALPRAFVWERGAGVTLLPLAPGDGQSEAAALNDRGEVVGWIARVGGASDRAVRWTVQPVEGRAPVVDRLHATVLPPGVIPGLSGIWLRVRLRDPGDPGPWDWYIRWNDRAAYTLQDVKYTGEFVFLRREPFRPGGPFHTVTVWATDPGGLTSEPATLDLRDPPR